MTSMLPHLPVPKNLYTRSGCPTSSAKPKEARNCNIVNADCQEVTDADAGHAPRASAKVCRSPRSRSRNFTLQHAPQQHPCNGHCSTREILNAIFPSSCDLGERSELGNALSTLAAAMGRYPKQQGRCETSLSQRERTVQTFGVSARSRPCSKQRHVADIRLKKVHFFFLSHLFLLVRRF